MQQPICNECGQHYLVGRVHNGKLVESIRDPSNVNFKANFFRPMDNILDEEDGEDNKKVFQLCIKCGEIGTNKLKCGHENSIWVIKEESPKDEDRADQMARCSVCGYNAAGHDPVKEVVHGTDGPHAVIATTLYLNLERKKVLAFADGRQEAAFFAWYLENSYKDILSRNLILKTLQKLSPHTQEGLSLQELSTGLHNIFKERKMFPTSMGDLV